jgi:glutamate synthase (NADPH/NADH) large chain
MKNEIGLYRSSFEHDNCGIGFVAHLKGKKSHSIVQMGLEVLENMSHRVQKELIINQVMVQEFYYRYPEISILFRGLIFRLKDNLERVLFFCPRIKLKPMNA